ncbi:phage tail spike protein [Bacillus cereus]|uniref:Tail spike domain-containing protein n=1 Tax=Bacillus cereus TaxID=1396 RepID=A0A9X7BG39_BACCE|nr:phage tail spike protein [Bacillus cereus]PED41971.1 hypothetical protein CON26_20915 [Bacillus cereus]PFV11212.1 hypothetical protein COK98_02780 [Bacillus cereus]
MRKPSGILHVADFKTEQIIAAIQPKDYQEDVRHWEIKNNVDILDFTVFDGTDDAATLIQQNLVLKEVKGGRIIPYVIIEVEQDSKKRTRTTYTAGEWVLLAKAGIIKPQRIEGKTVNEFIDMAVVGTKWKRGRTEYAGFHTMTIDEFIDPLTFLSKIAALFELEIQYRAEVVGSRIVGRYVDMVKKRGGETGKEVTLGKDLVGIRRIENSKNICTALVGFVRGEEDELITIESINNGLPYIVDHDAFQRWNERGQHKFGFYSPETEDQNMTPQRLMTLMELELEKHVNTSVSYEVEAQSIGRVFGLSHEEINEGDTIRIKDTGFTPKLYLEARVIAGDESFTDPTQDKYVFGDYREITDPNEELRKIYNKILASLGNKQEMIDQLDKLIKETDEKVEQAQQESEAAKELAEKVQENLENYQTAIYEGMTPPTENLEAGKSLWLDISNGKPGILKMWNGTEWEAIVPDVDSIEAVSKEEFDKAIEDILNDVADKAGIEYVDGKLQDKANVDETVSKEEFQNQIDSFVKKTEYETDQDGIIKELNTLGTSVKQTEEALVNKAEKTHVEQLAEGVQNISYEVSEVKQTAEGIKESVEKVEKDVDSQSKRITTVEKTAEGIKESIEKVEETQTEFDKKIVEVEKTAEGIKTNVESISKTQTEQGEEIKQAQATLETQAQEISGKVTITEVKDYVADFDIPQIKEDIEDNREEALKELAEKVATEDYNKKTTELERKISANEEGILLSAKKTEVYTIEEADGEFAKDAYVKEMEGRIDVNEEEIKLSVKEGDIISAINMSAEKITIDVEKLDINADTVVQWLTAKGIDTDIIKVEGDKITIDKNGVIVKMLDFLYEDERGLKTTVISKRNLIIDHDFSSTPKKVMAGNSNYSHFEVGRFWRPQGNVVMENNTLNFDYERMVNATRVDMYNYPETTVKNGIYPGNIYTLSAHYRCAMINGVRVTARPQLHVCFVTYRDGVHYDIWHEEKLSFDAPSILYGDIQRRAFTFTVPKNYNIQEHSIVIKIESADGDISKGTAVCVSGVQLVSGKYPSMYDWQAQSGEIYSGMMPIDSLEFGNGHGFINVSPDRKTFDIGGAVETKFHRNIRAIQGVNLGGNEFQGWGHIQFVEGNRGIGYYVHNTNGWNFNSLG